MILTTYHPPNLNGSVFIFQFFNLLDFHWNVKCILKMKLLIHLILCFWWYYSILVYIIMFFDSTDGELCVELQITYIVRIKLIFYFTLITFKVAGIQKFVKRREGKNWKIVDYIIYRLTIQNIQLIGTHNNCNFISSVK